MVGAGFSEPVLQAQAAFRAILDALSRPGTVHPLPQVPDAPELLSPGAAAVALTLCDHDTPVWLDAALQATDSVAQWLRFHCGCALVREPRDAAFAFVSNQKRLLPFEEFNLGTADYPDRSTTIVLEVENFGEGVVLALAGPGIRDKKVFRANPLPDDMAARLAANRALFPRGVDLLFTNSQAVAALPRSVRILES